MLLGRQTKDELGWGAFLVEHILHPLIRVVVIGFTAYATLRCVVAAFGLGFNSGMRSFAGVLLPLLAVTFLYAYAKRLGGEGSLKLNVESVSDGQSQTNHTRLERKGVFNVWVGVAISLGVGFIAMALVKVTDAARVGVPVTEVVMSTNLAALLFGREEVERTRLLSVAYGLAAGFLVFIVIFGFPARLA